MRSPRKYFSQPRFTLPVLIIAGLLLAACVERPENVPPQAPASTTRDSVTSAGASVDTPTDPPDEADAAPPESVDTAVSPVATSDDVEPTAVADTTAADQAQPTRKPASTYADLEVVTLLPRDAIPAIDNPRFLSAEEADEFYDPDELVMGVTFNGDSRAYSAPFLSNHEIVNDTVGGVKIAVTW